jgi:hypothetical protein
MILQIENIPETDIIDTVPSPFYSSIWFWLALIQFIIIVILLKKITKNSQGLAFHDAQQKEVFKAKNASVDMDNVMSSINGSRDLYKQLSRSCHPDKFVNTPMQEKAENIFQEISKNKRNYNALLELKKRAVNELNISIN